jgi:hypothetical protein
MEFCPHCGRECEYFVEQNPFWSFQKDRLMVRCDICDAVEPLANPTFKQEMYRTWIHEWRKVKFLLKWWAIIHLVCFTFMLLAWAVTSLLGV